LFAVVSAGPILFAGCAERAPAGFDDPELDAGAGGFVEDASATSPGSDSASGGFGSFGDGGGPTPIAADGDIPCPQGLMCNVSCGAAGATTGITGRVYDPAGKNPLYNVAVYVPAGDLQPLPKGVPTGANACSCGALFKSGALAATATAIDGSFTLTNVPVGNVALVLQVGKWRRALRVTTQACKTTSLPDRSLTLPGTLVGAGPDDDMPDIAVSTGSADTLECLMTRIGVPASEFVAGGANGGHVHVFSGGNDGPIPGGAGYPEWNVMPGAPPSYRALWANQSQLMPSSCPSTSLSCRARAERLSTPTR
jgi:hypothetical protein